MHGLDRFGNRWQQNGPNSFLATFTGIHPSSPQNNNRMDGYSYDSAGDMTNDGTHGYTYDAENRIISVDNGATATYVYDADGDRVQKTSTTGNNSDPAGTWIFFYDQSGRWVQEFNSPGNTFVRGNIYAALCSPAKTRKHKAKDRPMRPETNKHKTLGAALWLTILTDAAIIGAIVTKVYRSGISGLLAWFQQFHLVSVSATGDRATYKLEPDYRFTAFYIAVILGALVLTVLLLRIYLRTRRID